VHRRTAVRYRPRLPVLFHWSDIVEHTEGWFTNDIEFEGALNFSTKCPPIKSQIRIEVPVLLHFLISDY